jgi:NAD(P)-dependent dehydrogenase (short-subunit alcohol dehydrogenase family)
MIATLFFTGGTSGLGRSAALTLAAEGYHILLAARDESKTNSLIEELNGLGSAALGKISFIRCDLASLSSVRNACEVVRRHYPSVTGIINNAGVWCFEREESDDGIELTLQVNVIAPCLIVERLAPLLKANGGGRIVNTASGLHQGTIHFDDLEYRNRFSGFKAYRQSKLAIMLLTRFWAQRYARDGIGVYSQHPGLVNTGLVRGGGWLARRFFSWFGRTAEQGAETLVYLIRAERETLTNGAFYANKKIKKATATSENLPLATQLYEAVKNHL